jgi:hypothetical protein
MEASDCSYVGQVKAGRREGSGVLLCDTGLRFEGSFKNNQIEGPGVFDLPQKGGRWKGSLHRGVPHGPSIFTLPDGTTFHGIIPKRLQFVLIKRIERFKSTYKYYQLFY